MAKITVTDDEGTVWGIIEVWFNEPPSEEDLTFTDHSYDGKQLLESRIHQGSLVMNIVEMLKKVKEMSE